MTKQELSKSIIIEVSRKNWSPERVKNMIDIYNNSYKAINTNNIIQLVAEACHLTPEQITSKSRMRHIVIARQIAMYFLVKYRGYSLTRTGQFFEKDHATVIHSLKQVDNALETNDEMVCEPFLRLKYSLDNKINDTQIVCN